MYKKLITALVLIVSSNYSFGQDSQVTNRLYCNTTKTVFDLLRREYREEPMVYGRGATPEAAIMSLWINPNTGTWTIVVSTSDKTCVVAGGIDLRIVGDGGTSKSF